jgi:hypothetical protein
LGQEFAVNDDLAGRGDKAIESASAFGCVFRLGLGIVGLLMLLKLITGLFHDSEIEKRQQQRPEIGPQLNERPIGKTAP